jgi:1,4-dihydroxy-6-naphthoate synthase
MTLTLGFSPCPNDCFMFDAIVHQRIDLEGLAFTILMEDVEALNRRAFAGAIDVTKLSYHALAHSVSDFALLDAGSALGRGCGPLLIAARDMSIDEVAAGGVRIAIPGEFTTANFLLSLAFPEARNKTALVFSEIEAAVVEGRFDAGLIIHENRFTYQAKGLEKVIDLGEFWERTTDAPIPLGGIVVKRSLPAEVQQTMGRVMRRSVEYAFAHPDASREFVRAHAQEMSDAVMRQHIDLYVNEYSVDLGPDGRRAVKLLFERAVAAGIVPPPNVPVFVQRAGDAPPPAHDARMR